MNKPRSFSITAFLVITVRSTEAIQSPRYSLEESRLNRFPLKTRTNAFKRTTSQELQD